MYQENIMKTLTKTYVIVLVVFSTFYNVFAQETVVDSTLLDQPYVYAPFPNTVGSEYSTLLGYGLFYKVGVSKNLQLKFTGIPYYSANNYRSEMFYNIGSQLQLDFVKLRELRGYGLVGGAYFHSNITYNGSDANKESSNGLSLAVGIGIETRFFRRLIIHTELTGGYNSSTEVRYGTNYFDTSLKVGVGAGLGIVF